MDPSSTSTLTGGPVSSSSSSGALSSAAGTGSSSSITSSSGTTAAHARKSRLTLPTGADPLSGGRTGSSTTTSSSGFLGRSRNSSSSTTASSMSAALGGFTSAHLQHNNNSHSPLLHYTSRLTDLRQMDYQSALDQMKTLLTTRPQLVYKTSYYRKQTKNHWARDDPAFLVLQGVFLAIASVAYSVAFRVSLSGFVSFLLYSIVWNWLGLGILLATVGREIANRHLALQKNNSSAHVVRQQVEWLYAFDIHCNSFFPVFVLLYGVQFFLLPLVLGEGLLPLLLANTLYAAAFAWYWYITHLGYRSLPFLSSTEVFLFPIAAIALLYVLMVVGYPLGFGWNAARVAARFYFM